PQAISIHAPREGGDELSPASSSSGSVISIHAPREGGDSKNAQKFFVKLHIFATNNEPNGKSVCGTGKKSSQTNAI
ncbi:MAG: hypothetical protein LUD54_05065, partial [Oscillospiraceae bacterium]|nr:hypothetical protein [Oscillospiraceae bacterium]